MESGARNAAEDETTEAIQRTNSKEDVGPQTGAFPVPISPPQSNALPAIKTEQEQTLDLDQKLNKSLNTFDGKLLKERQILEEQESFTGNGGTQAGATANGALDTGTEVGSVSGEVPSRSPGVGEKPQSTLQRGSSASQQGGRPSTPPDIPDSHDDDIIARQLREAAKNETDPALREKLWEEYRKYKRGGSS